MGAWVLSTCATHITSLPEPRPAPDCGPADEGSACIAVRELHACVAATGQMLPRTTALCEQAWQTTGEEEAAANGAFYAFRAHDDDALERWEKRARPTVRGARILALAGEMWEHRDEFARAEDDFRRALDLQIDRDPIRAANSALFLLALVQNSQPAEESIRLARIAWEQAELGGNELVRAGAAGSLVELMIDIGELSTAAVVIDRMDASGLSSWGKVRDVAHGRLEAAQGRIATAIALFQRASRRDPEDPSIRSKLPHDSLELVHLLLGDGQVAEARAELDRARALVEQKVLSSHDIQARLAAAEASVELAEDNVAAALASADRGLAIKTRDAARVRLLKVRGDALARRGDAVAAEQAWRAAAESVEAWRASIPTTQLRSGLVARHRGVLESWLDSTGERGDADGALDVVQRIIGRELLDRIYQREANAPAAADASIRDLEHRLAVHRELSVTMSGAQGRGDLRDVAHDMIAIMLGARSVWVLRRARGRWSITRASDRKTVTEWVDAYRGNVDDPDVAARLGGALFPEATLPPAGTPLVVMLDPELSDVALAGLRVGDRYLVERAEIFEVLAPDLLFTGVPQGPWQPPVAVADPRRDLPDAAAETIVVAEITGAARYVGSQATREALVALRRPSLLHVATHSKVEDGRATFVLADDALSANEIINLELAPRLAVIATCRSLVDDHPGRSLVAAFLAAGSPAVIGVKHALDDRDGAELMRSFYRLHGATSPLRALALAQRAAIAAGLPPRAWATVSFFGVGGWLEH